MRLIDADALDAAFTDLRFSADGTLAHWGDRPDWCLHGSEVEKLIENAPTIGGWISVKDRLPPNADHPGAFCPRYLVCTDFGITVGWYNPDKGKWYGCGWWMYDTNRVADVDFERGDIPKRVVLPVEAWMPLPEPPEVKQDG